MTKQVVLDLETKYSFDEVGGRDNLEKLGVSLVGLYNYPDNKFLTFEEGDLRKLEKLLLNIDQIIGFNIKNFDLPVLQPYISFDLGNKKALDLMESVENFLGYRVSLDNISKATLKREKSGHGLDAIRWYREGDIKTLKKYCLSDVCLTRDIYEFGLSQGYILCNLQEFNPLFSDEPLKEEYAIPAAWAKIFELNTLRNLLEEVYKGQLLVEIDYISATAHKDEDFRKKRVIEIQEFSTNSVKAYCFLRKEAREFKINRILSAHIV